MQKITKIILVVVISSVILTGTSLGIWFTLKEQVLGNHPDPDWELMITGSVIGGDFNITLQEIIDMPWFERNYIIRGTTTNTYTYRGVSLNYLFNTELPITDNATTVTFIAIDAYQISFAIADMIAEEARILAYARDGQYLLNQTAGGNGYLRLIIPPENDEDFNGPNCLKWIVEIKFS